jgi:rhodanese-related sulfurtransferase
MEKNKMSRNRITREKKRTVSPWLWVGLVTLVLVTVFAAAQALRGTAVGTGASAADAQVKQSGSSALPAEISVSEAAQMRTEGALMLDVREQLEWDEFHMPDARLIPLAQLENRMSDLPKDRDIIVVCRSGNRSAQGRDILLQAGFTRVTSMAGGMNEWKANGFPTQTGP